MKRLVALAIPLIIVGLAWGGVWESSCLVCHKGKIAPTKEELLKKYKTKDLFLKAAESKVKEGRMPRNLEFERAAEELYSGKTKANKDRGDKRESYAELKKYFTPLPSLPPIPEDNPLTLEKIELGRMLYYDPRLSRSKLISCNTCHNLAIGGDDNQKSSLGHEWKTGGRNAPTTLNAGFLKSQFWDGRAPTLEAQAAGPLQANVEMNSTPELVEKRLKAIPEYVELFQKAFPGEKDPVTFENVTKAIAAFERILVTPNSPFQRYLNGDETALTKEQKEGMRLFVKKGCIACHNGPVLSDGQFHKFKWNDDLGRYKVTKKDKDKYMFRTPQLLNVAVTAPYFHDGSVNSLKEAVKIMAEKELGIELSDREATLITEFLKSLTGEVPLEARVVPVLPGNNPE